MSDKLLTPVEASKLLQAVGLVDLGAKWLTDQMSRGKIPYIIVAGKRRIRSDYIDKMIDDWFNGAGGKYFQRKRNKPDTTTTEVGREEKTQFISANNSSNIPLEFLPDRVRNIAESLKTK